MKFLKVTIAAIFLTVLFSCDKLDELTEVKVNATESVNINVAVLENETNFSKTETISVDDKDVQENLDRIEKVTVKKLTYQFTNVTGNSDATLSGSITFGGSSLDFVSVNPKTVENQVFTVTETAVVNAFANAIKSGAQVTVVLAGTSDNAPVSATMVITAEMEIVVDVI